MNLIQSILIAIVEGITEYLPVSSTGHIILTEWLLKIKSSDFIKLYTVAIQLGAIMAVVVAYYKRFFQSIDFYIKIAIAFIPAAIIGFLCNDYIDQLLESPITVAIALIIGGIIFLYCDKWFIPHQPEKPINNQTAFKIGLFQIAALIPGVSRSGATIFGGLQQKLSRQQAAEFSFFLAVPTMFAATIYKMIKYPMALTQTEIKTLVIGNIVAFVVALIAIKSFIALLNKFGFKPWGWYRIIAGLIILLLYYFYN